MSEARRSFLRRWPVDEKEEMKKGFTLIEILIVIAIIAVLSSLIFVGFSSAQKRGRDARRVADLRQMQNAVQLYFQKCGFYPGGENCSPRTIPQWSQLRDALLGNDLGISNVPMADPSGRNYAYTDFNSGSEYVLWAQLDEQNSPVLANDLDGRFGPLDCSDSPIPYYCVGL